MDLEGWRDGKVGEERERSQELESGNKRVRETLLKSFCLRLVVLCCVFVLTVP